MTTRQDVLRHYGTKGMQWGVRNDNRTRGQRRADKKWTKNIYSLKGAAEVHNVVADRMNNGETAALNSRHPRGDLTRPQTRETQAYIQDYNNTITRLTNEAVGRVHGISPSGRLKARLDTSDPNQLRIVVDEQDVSHADEPLPTMYFYLKLDARGQRIEAVYDAPDVDELEQSDMDDDILEHYGTKGMKWGVRKTDKASGNLVRKFNKRKLGVGKTAAALILGGPSGLYLARNLGTNRDVAGGERVQRSVTRGEAVASLWFGGPVGLIAAQLITSRPVKPASGAQADDE